METKKNQFDVSAAFSTNSYLNSLLQHVNNSSLPDNIFKNSKNFIIVISGSGHFKKISSSLFDAIGYTDIELLSISVKKVLLDGGFFFENKSSNYYFENTIGCKSNKFLKIKWRLIPDVIEDAFVFVGWEIKP